MKKIIVGLMGLMMVAAMSLPVAAQGRKWNRDNQTTNIRRDNNQRNDFGYSRQISDQRDNRYDMERGRQNQYDFDRNTRWQQRDRQNTRINGVGTILRVLLRH